MVPRDPQLDHLRRPGGWYALCAVGGVLSVIMLVIVAQRAASSTDFRDFWENAVHFRQTGEISAELGVHNYLPFFTIFMAPWSVFPLTVGAVLFSALSIALFVVTVVLVENLLQPAPTPQPRTALLITLALALPYVYACVVVGNVGLLVLFLIVATWFLVERGHEWPAGLALGLAILIKLLPGLLLVCFLLKRRWRVLGSTVGVVVVLGLGLPLATLGWSRTVSEHQEFCRRAIAGGSAYQTIMSDHPVKAHLNNNALPMVLRRLLTPLNSGREADRGGLVVNIADWPRARVWTLYVLLLVVLLGASVAVSLQRVRRWPPETPAALQTLREQFGLWCCLALLASPLVWTHYLPLVYWPLALLVDRGARRQDTARGIKAVIGVTLLLWLLGLGLLAWPAARAAGAQIGSVFCLWLAMLILAASPPINPWSGRA